MKRWWLQLARDTEAVVRAHLDEETAVQLTVDEEATFTYRLKGFCTYLLLHN
ncbi:hypothetical protein HanRHA438_Chr02g0051771 [Helianthus annuus]|nr:hypothetical protein HanRHA438_Chr02g0051771 [Helianthus annuus]